jgi:uncharacterized membrane protein YebE (DUF533 family)
MFSILASVGIAAAIGYIAYKVALVKKSKNMHKKEEKMREFGVAPYGSGLCHGMVVDQNNKRAVKSDEKKSRAWYSRLA